MNNHSDDFAVRDQVALFLGKYFGDRMPSDGDNIFESGYVNSLFTMQLVTFVEKNFGIVVEDDDLDINNFKSIDAICAFVGGKRAALAA